ncbi:MAG TPA: hypothetical protein VMV94_13970 [Phycisphaerae bacterium]|nr:hypothetical protein [Phycisphaerae bacterium]
MKNEEITIIGVDAGATEVKAHAVSCGDLHQQTSFALAGPGCSRGYESVPGFTTVPMAVQLAQRDAGDIKPGSTEFQQGRLWVDAAADAIRDVVQVGSGCPALIGVGMPGLKTPDGRGVCVINNGPRIPDYLDALEDALRRRGIALAAPVAVLGSDADYCGLGEQYGAGGLFRDVENAYYVGCGTGIADALKLRGRLVPFDGAQAWLHKAWQIPSAFGPTFERLVSAKSFNRVYAELVTVAASDDGGAEPRVFPEVAALAGHPIAMTWIDAASLILAELIFERLWTIKNGRPLAPHRGEAYLRLDPNHEYRGILLDRVVIGQRLGMVYADARCEGLFRDRLEGHLAALIAHSGDAEMAPRFLAPGDGRASAVALRPGLVQPSTLRAAPALGAAVAAVQAWAGGQPIRAAPGPSRSKGASRRHR